MTTMIERVAHAIADKDIGSSYSAHYETLARAAIAAMREPTEVMSEASNLGYGSAQGMRCVWQAMINAALGEK